MAVQSTLPELRANLAHAGDGHWLSDELVLHLPVGTPLPEYRFAHLDPKAGGTWIADPAGVRVLSQETLTEVHVWGAPQPPSLAPFVKQFHALVLNNVASIRRNIGLWDGLWTQCPTFRDTMLTALTDEIARDRDMPPQQALVFLSVLGRDALPSVARVDARLPVFDRTLTYLAHNLNVLTTALGPRILAHVAAIFPLILEREPSLRMTVMSHVIPAVLAADRWPAVVGRFRDRHQRRFPGMGMGMGMGMRMMMDMAGGLEDEGDGPEEPGKLVAVLIDQVVNFSCGADGKLAALSFLATVNRSAPIIFRILMDGPRVGLAWSVDQLNNILFNLQQSLSRLSTPWEALRTCVNMQTLEITRQSILNRLQKSLEWHHAEISHEVLIHLLKYREFQAPEFILVILQHLVNIPSPSAHDAFLLLVAEPHIRRVLLASTAPLELCRIWMEHAGDFGRELKGVFTSLALILQYIPDPVGGHILNATATMLREHVPPRAVAAKVHELNEVLGAIKEQQLFQAVATSYLSIVPHLMHSLKPDYATARLVLQVVSVVCHVCVCVCVCVCVRVCMYMCMRENVCVRYARSFDRTASVCFVCFLAPPPHL